MITFGAQIILVIINIIYYHICYRYYSIKKYMYISVPESNLCLACGSSVDNSHYIKMQYFSTVLYTKTSNLQSSYRKSCSWPTIVRVLKGEDLTRGFVIVPLFVGCELQLELKEWGFHDLIAPSYVKNFY